jgi:two-component system sensor histidine kinase/response regulator
LRMVTKAKILIVDDEEVVLDSCSQILKGSGSRILTARNGEQGLQLVRDEQPDLVFVDLKMPGVSGFDVIKGIREIDPTIVTIVITGFATVSSAIEAMKNGAYDFLPKPFTPEEFRMITQRGLENRRLVLETISLRKERETLRENFAAIVSHELKAPLGAVQQNLYVLADEMSDQLSSSQKERLARIQNSVGDLTKLILTWLRVLSVDVSKIQETFRPVQLETVVSKAMEGVQPQAVRKAIEIVAPDAKELPTVQGDEGTLVETLINILGNAIKYSRTSSKIVVSCETMEHEAVISVSDSGAGISEEDLPHIFGDFYTGKAAQSEERGSGIGLAVARRIVEAHHGTITVQSVPGKGSTFAIHLPAMIEWETAGPAANGGIIESSLQ